jgi:hypothetical protein
MSSRAPFLLLVVFLCLDAGFLHAQGRRASGGRTQEPAAQPQAQPQEQAPVAPVEPAQPTFDFSRYRGKTEFRNVPWGASKEDILRQDKSTRKATGADLLVVTTTLNDVNYEVRYFFWRNNLIKGVYLSMNNLGEYSKFLEKYNYFKGLLITKHGKPYIDTANWSSMELKREPNKWLLAVQRGQLEHFAIWERDGIVVQIKFSQIEGQPRILIEYYIANIDADIERTDDKEILKDL